MKYRVIFEFRNEYGEWVEDYLDNNGAGFSAYDASILVKEISASAITTRYVRYEVM